MFKHILVSVVAAAGLLSASNNAQAHFLWLVAKDVAGQRRVEIYFSEAAEPDDPDLLDRVKEPAVWQLTESGAPQKLAAARDGDSLVAKTERAAAEGTLYVLSHNYGVTERGGNTFLLRYYAKTGPRLGHPAWAKLATAKYADLDLVPEPIAGGVRIKVLWQGKPVSGSEVKISGPGLSEELTANSDTAGNVEAKLAKSGLYSIRARHIETTHGKQGDQTYDSIRHYATLALAVGDADNTTKASPMNTTKNAAPVIATLRRLPDLPQPVTSFGAAIVDGRLYTYGGHTGEAHSYSAQEQEHTLRRLNLNNPDKWETVAEGPHRQGLALVAHAGKLYRVGGFAAKNAKGEKHDLHSEADVACFDPQTKQWQALPSLPEPRSSHDAAVLGDRLYVVGGWQLNGDKETHWHTTACVIDLSARQPQWQSLPAPPFERRALAVAAHNNKLYVLGGMQHEGGPTTRVDIFNPADGTWSQGPSLPGEPMEGFGCSGFDVGGKLFVSTFKGRLLVLSDDGKEWHTRGTLERARFFHRLLPLGDSELVVVGGANMETGKFADVDVISAH